MSFKMACFWNTVVISVTCETMSMTVNMTLGMKTLAVDILKVKWHDFLFTVTGCYTYEPVTKGAPA